MNERARKRLISRLEGVVTDHIFNNGNSIRYPITFNDGSQLRGKFILDVNEGNEDKFFSGRYVFGANELFIYDALEAVILQLEEEGVIDSVNLDFGLRDEDYDE